MARIITGRVLQSLRGYFLGVTIVAAFNAVVVGVGALILGVPQAGTIALITFLGAYIPYLGAWGAGAFAVLIALGGAGTDAAIGMIVIQLLANGLLQQLVQPIAYGAALGHPPARGPRRHDRRRRAVRRGGADPRRPHGVRREPDHRRARRAAAGAGGRPPSSAPGAVPSPAG